MLKPFTKENRPRKTRGDAKFSFSKKLLAEIEGRPFQTVDARFVRNGWSSKNPKHIVLYILKYLQGKINTN